jgi:hypothetical protein
MRKTTMGWARDRASRGELSTIAGNFEGGSALAMRMASAGSRRYRHHARVAHSSSANVQSAEKVGDNR